MGEVGAVIPEKPTESPLSTTVNGEVNGLCKDSDEPMDVDADDSQASSENGLADSVSESNSVSKLPIVSKTGSLVASKPVDLPATNEILDDKEDTKSPVTQSEENSQPISEENEDASRDQPSLPDAQEIEDTEEENSQAESQVSPENGDSQDVDGPAKEDTSSQDNNDVEMTEESNSQENTIEENSQSSSHSEKSDEVKENGEKDDESVRQAEEATTEDVNSESSVNKSSTVDGPTKENGEVNGSEKEKEKPSLNISDDITIIESDDDDEPKSSTEPIEKASNLVKNPASKAVTTTAVKQANISAKPPMQVDDDAPVIIPSDSESEDESSKKKETSTPTESLDLSMKQSQPDEDMSGDDCVVIEDDDKKEKDPLSITPVQRKSLIRSREMDDDDDIAEIVDGDLPPSKRSRNSNSPSVNSPQFGQITIKDARSLMPTSFQESLPKSYQQQFAQQMLGAKGGKEAPGLVVIDTNSLLKPGLTPPNPNKGGVTITNVMPNPQGIFPNNIRPGLAPIAPPKLVPTTGGVSLPVSNPTLLPALTDDMFVLEAPSFIVPYIYEKPPEENLKEVVTKLEAEIEKIKKELKKSEKEDDNKKRDGETITGDSVNASSGSKTGEKKKKKKKSEKNQDDSWDELDTSTDDEASDGEPHTKVLIKDSNPDMDSMKSVLTPDGSGSGTAAKSSSSPADDKKTDPKSENYFESPLGKFFIDIGINLVQEYVQTDLLRMQKRKVNKSMKSASAEMELGIRSLQKNIEASKRRNEPFKFEMKRCEYCNFKSESALSMAHHYETPHMRQYLYKCNFCPYETRPAHDILFHMEAVHNIKGRLEKALAYNQCPNCPFEENGKSKFARHIPVCAKKFRPEINLNPPHDWEAPAKIPRIKPRHGLVGTATAYQAMAAQAAAQKAQLAAMAARAAAPPNPTPRSRGNRSQNARMQPNPVAAIRSAPPIRTIPGVVMPNNYQISGGQIIQVSGSGLAILPNAHGAISLQQQQQLQQNSKKSSGQQPSISITPLPRQPGNMPNPMSLSAAVAIPPKPQIAAGMKPGQAPTGGNKASFVICEICDGYIKDLEQLRNHMQWMHKVKIHPKMIHNRPPLNCQKCQYRFFTDQGLERHLLGSHGLVTSSMQEAANKGKDAGRCPVCGRMYQWKLLNHVSRDHHMTLKPAHLSYKCTVCTATFGMYKQFENHVYTAHSTVAKKAMDGKKSNNNSMSGSSNSSGMAGGSSGTTISGLTITNTKSLSNAASLSSISSGDSLLKPLKINDEITIIPQPASKSRNSMQNDYESHIIGKSISRR